MEANRSETTPHPSPLPLSGEGELGVPVEL